MASAKQMLDTYPRSFNVDAQVLAACIEACFDCGQTCRACADACLSEENVADLAKCIRLDLDCADVCVATGKVLSRQTEYDANLTKSRREDDPSRARRLRVPVGHQGNRPGWGRGRKPTATANPCVVRCR
jgi:hypothetical protein